MDIQYAILGLLNWKPFSGYDLKKIISDSDLFYWSGNNNQIYYSLVQLHEQGWVTQTVEVQENLPAKKIYDITDRGREELRRSAMVNPELPDLRNSFLIQLAWTDQLTDAELDTLLAAYEAEVDIQYRMRLAGSGWLEESPARTEREKVIWQHIHENILSSYRSELDWVRRLRSDLDCSKTT